MMGAVTHMGRGPAVFPFSRMTLAGGRFYLSGHVGQDAAGRIGFPDCYRQTLTLFENIRRTLAEAGLDLDRIAKMTVFLTDMADKEAFDRAFAQVFRSFSEAVPGAFAAENVGGAAQAEAPVACTCVGVVALPNPAAVVELELEGIVFTSSCNVFRFSPHECGDPSPLRPVPSRTRLETVRAFRETARRRPDGTGANAGGETFVPIGSPATIRSEEKTIPVRSRAGKKDTL